MDSVVVQNDLPVQSEMVQLLMDIGYVATGRGFQSQANDIFNGIIAARPNSELPLIGLAVNKLNFGNFVEAAKILSERALVINPDNGTAKCFLAMAVRSLGGNAEAQQLLEEVVNNDTDTVSQELAKGLLQQKN